MRHALTLPFALFSTGSLPAQWAGTQTPSNPTARTDAACAYHLGSAGTVLFGGAGVSPFALRSDTWLYDGTNWTQLAPNTSPTGRFGMAMAYDLVRNRGVMFGGITSLISVALPNNQTWEWDGSDWIQATPIAAPAGRAHYGIAYDLARQRVVMFGGSTNPNLLITSNETWEYDGTIWTQVGQTSLSNPGPRQYPGMVYHQALGRTVLFGGSNPHTGGNSDTWLFDGTAWTLAPNLGATPSPRQAPRLAYHTGRGTVLMHGGSTLSNGAPLDETWELSGFAWQQFQVPQPSSRSRSHLAFDPARSKLVLWGGISPTNQGPTDTWEFGAYVVDAGAGCSGTGGVPQLAASAPPQIGGAFPATLTQLAPGAGVGAIGAGLSIPQQPLPLDPFGMPGCQLHLDLQTIVFLPVVGGAVTVQFAIPNRHSMLGVQVSQQGGLSLDPATNQAGLVVRNAITAVVGY